jgi:hypothetical protein
MSLHIVEHPREITRDQMDAAFAALGFDWRKCEWIRLDLEGLRARLREEDLVGTTLGWVEIDIPVRPGRTA